MLAAMGDVEIRAAVAADGRFIGDMVVVAANWRGGDRGREETLADPGCAHYCDGWPRSSDLGVVATADGSPVGAAWLRLFPESDPGYGFVDVDTPELSIGVVAGRRGQGVGRMLMRALADVARNAGLTRISLSVEQDNPATGLYRSEGYRIVTSDESAHTMLLDLRTGSTGTG
jgi:GNAT superfamily N-acetyltransferase